ncbi:uncharacterized protein F4822DRAFT_424784 [Hypoxylon trugodes]|uniref:uncharacterized protein n=1 Tax=Hypoxylon trugodes TaxID=326681 RepID=UPI0021A1654D|nr:uncharacterized protein F4822DRAFT_424784 [Hypoxylon trugodes]KAI1394307.1 hypothetical protein F4822DRAFT_424784 [Hypoxylon trugodes]
MGLPLWREPEPDATAAPAANPPRRSPSDPANARSTIRRVHSPRRQNNNFNYIRRMRSTREQRLRELTARFHGDDAIITSSNASNTPRTDATRRLPPIPTDSDLPYNPNVLDIDIVPPPDDEEPGEEELNSSMEELLRRGDFGTLPEPTGPTRVSDRVFAALHEQDSNAPSNPPAGIDLHRPRYAISSRALLARDSGLTLPPAWGAIVSDYPPGGFDDIIYPHRARRRYTRHTPYSSSRLPPRVRYNMDGLGDRNRSLSPEGDGVWDTLQSTLTPDPQPPSVGSSFASIAASQNSQNPTAPSSYTTITTPEADVEPPCDPVNETDGAEDNDSDEIPSLLPPRRPTPLSRRSYAAVASDDPEWLSGMHRIVRGLATREDIPDEWWAEAGLTRSMSSSLAWDELN